MSTNRSSSKRASHRPPDSLAYQSQHAPLESSNHPSYSHWLRSQQPHRVVTQQQHFDHIQGASEQAPHSYISHPPYAPSSYSTYRPYATSPTLLIPVQPRQENSRAVLLPPILSSSAGSPDPRSKKPTTRRACQACKQAHVRCDEEKPCTRCRTQNLECIPAEQRRRGRPPRSSARDILRDRGVNVSSAPSGAEGQESIPAVTTRPSSFQPEIREDTSLVSQPHVPYQTFSPVAFLDITLIVMRVNESFKATFGPNMRILGRHIEDLIETEYLHLLQHLRQAIVDEKSFHQTLEPFNRGLEAITPSIPPEMDAIDIARVVAPFADQRFKMAFRLATGPLTLTVSFRLAKTSTYFVVLTLPDRRGHLPVYLMEPLAMQDMTANTFSKIDQPQLFAPSRTHGNFVGSSHFSASAPASPRSDVGQLREQTALWHPVPNNIFVPSPRNGSLPSSHMQPQLGNPYASPYRDQYLTGGLPAGMGSQSLLHPLRGYDRLAPGHEPRRPRSAEVAQVLSRMSQTARPTTYRQISEPQEYRLERSEQGTKRRRDSPPVGNNERPTRRLRGNG